MKRKNLIFIAFLIVTVFGLYWKTFSYDLIWDSKIYIEQNILFAENHPIGSAFKFGYFREQLGVNNVDFYYRPLLTASFMLENKIWGLKNPNLRLTNLIIYILSLIFLYIFFKNQSDKKYFPEIATLLFTLYPLNVENIVWVLGRNDLFLLFWGSLTLLFLDFFVQKGKYIFLICSSLFYLIGILSKEAFLFFLPILFLYEFIKRKKLSIPYHLSNVVFSIFFFILKNKILGIKNLSLIFFSNIIDNLKVAIASLGYYFRSIIFPIYYDMFLPLRDVMNLLYILLGILAALLFIYLLYKSRKDNEIIIPLSIIIVFIAGHLILSFTNLYPFKIYSRYMMIPALGFIWIFAKYIGWLKEKVRFSLVFLILVFFIPSIILNAYSYRNELSFFQKANRTSPGNSYVLFQIAKAYHEKKNYLEAGLFLNEALSCRQRKETAMLLSLLYADIEFRKADYKKVFEWLESIEDFASSPDVELAPLMKSQINLKKALVYIAQGKTEQAENLLKWNIEIYKNQKESYDILYKMYIGHNLWEKAKDLERIMKNRFPSLRSMDTIQSKKKFDSFSPEEKIGFFIQHRNFNSARGIIRTLSTVDLDHKILLARLYLVEGKERESKNIINEIIAEYSDDFRVFNTIGNLYLKEFIRVNEALFYFQKSLETNKDQPELIHLVNQLSETYLSKMKNGRQE